MVMNVGVLGFSEGNGHPFSFSAIVNGYDNEGFAAAGWPVIHAYLQKQPPEQFGFPGFRVTQAWTQDAEVTRKLCRACRIESAVHEPRDMLPKIDAVMILRDDWESHAALARPFLAAGKFVFIDKPLTLDAAELEAFRPALESGRLMSSAGLRYAGELDCLRGEGLGQLGRLKLIQAAVLNGVDKYGIHMVEAVRGLGNLCHWPWKVTRLDVPHPAFLIRTADDVSFTLDCLGAVGKTFHLSFFGERTHAHFDLHDNFTAFRRTLTAFFTMIETGKPAIDPEETYWILRFIATASRLKVGGTSVVGWGAGLRNTDRRVG